MNEIEIGSVKLKCVKTVHDDKKMIACARPRWTLVGNVPIFPNYKEKLEK